MPAAANKTTPVIVRANGSCACTQLSDSATVRRHLEQAARRTPRLSSAAASPDPQFRMPYRLFTAMHPRVFVKEAPLGELTRLGVHAVSCGGSLELRGEAAVDVDGLTGTVGVGLACEDEHLRYELLGLGEALEAGTVLEDQRAFGFE